MEVNELAYTGGVFHNTPVATLLVKDTTYVCTGVNSSGATHIVNGQPVEIKEFRANHVFADNPNIYGVGDQVVMSGALMFMMFNTTRDKKKYIIQRLKRNYK